MQNLLLLISCNNQEVSANGLMVINMKLLMKVRYFVQSKCRSFLIGFFSDHGYEYDKLDASFPVPEIFHLDSVFFR